MEMIKWEINNKCNLKCPFCLIGEGDKRSTLSLEGLKYLMDKFNDMGVNYIDFFGKEVLLDDTFIKLVRYADMKSYPFLYTLITNGKNLKKYMEDITDLEFESVTISYDGEVNRPSFDLDELLAMDNRVDINFSIDVHNENVDILEEKIIALLDKGASNIYVKPITNRGVSESTNLFISPERYKEFVESLYMKEPLGNIIYAFPLNFSHIVDEVKIPSVLISEDKKCNAGEDCVFVNSMGLLYPCGYMSYEQGKDNYIDLFHTSSGGVKRYLNKIDKIKKENPSLRLCRIEGRKIKC